MLYEFQLYHIIGFMLQEENKWARTQIYRN